MWPVLVSIGPVDVPAYGVCVVLGMLAAGAIRRRETARTGQASWPGARWVSVGALAGAVVGSKVGMVLFEPMGAWTDHLARALAFDFSGRTVVGGIIGGYLGVELTKRLVGITRSTGDGWAVALPVAQGIGRIGCWLHGCCYGAVSTAAWALPMHGAPRHPVQLVEAVADLSLAAALWSIRKTDRPAGHLFRRYLVGYAVIRFGCEFLRGDPSRMVGPLTAVQVVCGLAALGFTVALLRGEWPRAAKV